MKPLIAKLTRPRLAGVVERDRLNRHLDRAGKNRIVWVSAPAGSGKTTLVASWLDSRRLPCLWYQADEGDADIATFFSYLGTAAKHAAPRYRSPLPLFTPEYSLGIPTFTKRYFETLFSRLKPPFCLVIDNYQDVPAGSLFHETVCHGLSVAPEGISVVVVSRVDPPPVFARLQAGSRLEIVPKEEIWFTYDESRELVESRGRKRPSDDVLTVFFQKTRGWAAGLVLMSDSMARAGGPHAQVDTSAGSVFDYFASELFARAEPGTRDFLLKTAFFPRMTAKNARELTENERADQILSNLGRSNFFIQRYATPGLVYEYHPLFRDFLLNRAKESFSPAETAGIKKKTALLLLVDGQTEYAAELLAETGDWGGYIPLILTHAQSLAGQGRFAMLTSWIGRVPKPIFESQPWLVFWLGVCKKPVIPPESRALFESALNLFESQGDRTGMFLSWAEIVDTFLYEWNDFRPLDRWITRLEERMKQDGTFPSAEIEARVASCLVNALVFRRPDHPDIKTWLERARNNAEKIPDAGMRMLAYVHLLNYYLWAGDHAISLWIAEKIRDIARSPAATPSMKIISNWTEAAECGIVSADFESSLRLAEEGLERGENNGIHIWDHLTLTFASFSALCKGDLAAADKYLKQLETASAVSQFQNSVARYHVIAWKNFLAGDFAQAAAASEKVLAAVTELGMVIHIALYNIVLAHVYHELGEYRKADERLSLAQRLVRGCQSQMLEYLCLLVQAYILLRRGGSAAGIDVLRKAMALGRSHDYVGVFFWWDPRMMAYLCTKALELGIEVEYVTRLVRKRNLVPEAPPAHIESWPWPIKIYTLGRFELRRGGEPIVFSGKVQQKPLAMLKALIAFGGGEASDEMLTDALWPEAEGDLGRNSFDTTLHRLRKLLGDEGIVKIQDGKVSLDGRTCWVDAWAFEDTVRSAEPGVRSDGRNADRQKSATRDLESGLGKAIALYRGHFLPAEGDAPWALSMRERLRSKYLNAVGRLGRLQEESGEYEKAAEVFQGGLGVDDLSEEFYQRLMLCYHQLGRKAEAATTYCRCRETLSQKLGLTPSEKTMEIYRKIMA